MYCVSTLTDIKVLIFWYPKGPRKSLQIQQLCYIDIVPFLTKLTVTNVISFCISYFYNISNMHLIALLIQEIKQKVEQFNVAQLL